MLLRVTHIYDFETLFHFAHHPVLVKESYFSPQVHHFCLRGEKSLFTIDHFHELTHLQLMSLCLNSVIFLIVHLFLPQFKISVVQDPSIFLPTLPITFINILSLSLKKL